MLNKYEIVLQHDLKSLQFLRALASTSVVYYHVGSYPVFGSFGVDIFFVLSGFVMGLLVDKKQDLLEFTVGRISRIVPLYWIFTVILYFVILTFPQFVPMSKASLTDLLKSLLFIPYYRDAEIFAPILGVGWTLNYEIFFYLCIALSIGTGIRHIFLKVLFLIFACHIFFGLIMESRVLNYFFGRTFVFEFLLGFVCFYIYKNNFTAKCPNVLLFLLGMISYLIMALFQVYQFHFDNLFLYGIPSMILIISFSGLERWLKTNRSHFLTLLSNLGDSSYAVYLTHFFVIELFKKVFYKYQFIFGESIFFTFFLTLLCLIIGNIVFHLIDKPTHIFFKKKLNFYLRVRRGTN